MTRSATRPRIGIDVDHEHDGRRWVYKLPTRYVEVVIQAGGLPVLILPNDPRSPDDILADVDGLLMTGGDDIHPRVIGEEPGGRPMRLLSVQRERFVLALAASALRREASFPILGVCLGAQALNVAGGGDLCLDLYSEGTALHEHRSGAEHSVLPEPGGRIDAFFGGQPQRPVSHHHQAVRRLGAGFVVDARAEDGVIESFRDPQRAFLLAVQWHPEAQAASRGGAVIITALVEAARRARACGEREQ
ncbi:MAG TPA: gamma-glutamyl-gamma-aminobutyrate hydrolase family protein [Planctomycetota bacterium]|nr:gamma-glutamyl-gamma-aminobutyrate hydrolase family protein [Planctomycetota bacterium]